MAGAYVDPQSAQSDVTGRIIAAAMQVQRRLSPGLQEVIYKRALALCFFNRKTDHFNHEKPSTWAV
jgi:hypothetical protein